MPSNKIARLHHAKTRRRVAWQPYQPSLDGWQLPRSDILDERHQRHLHTPKRSAHRSSFLSLWRKLVLWRSANH